MKLRNLVTLSLVFSGLLLGSCATSPSVETKPSGIRLLAASDIAKFGNSFDMNPLLPASSFIRGQVGHFIVLEFAIRIERSEMVNAWARLEDSEGRSMGSALSENDMIDYRATYAVDSGDAKGRAQLARIYLPGDEFKCRKGSHLYYLVVRSQAPIKQGTRVVARLAIDDQEPIVFNEELPSVQ